MKFLHTADLHIGKTVNEFSMQADQEYVLEQMVRVAREYQADAFVIAGDVYDRSVPAAEAVELLDAFLTALVRENIPVLMIAGNHDSGKRLMFAGEILAQKQIYIAGNALAGIMRVQIKGVEFVLLPFVRPAEAGAANSDQALRLLLKDGAEAETEVGAVVPVPAGQTTSEPAHHIMSATPRTTSQIPHAAAVLRHPRVLITHCFATAAGREPELSDSENTVHVGGVDNVDVSAFADFDYVALGHIHKPQRIGNGEVWYAGAPLAYSFSEDSAQKGLNLVDIQDDGKVKVERIALKPLHAMRTVRGTMEELLEAGEKMRLVGDPAREDYLRAVLTDEDELLNPIQTLRSVYPNVMQIVLAKNERRNEEGTQEIFTGKTRPGMEELFASFYEQVRGEQMDDRRQALVRKIAQELE